MTRPPTEAAPPLISRRGLRERNVDIIITTGFVPINEEEMDVQTLYDDQMVVVAATTNPWTRRRRIELAELANEPWALPTSTSWGAAVVSAFRANGVEPPLATVTTSSIPLRSTLLATGRFLTVLHESHLHFPVRHPSLKVLPIDLSATRRPTRLITLKGRTLSPVARLFIECAREVAKPLAKRK
jgi:DNA-binding transcriptional LysR family regulator